MAAEEAAEDGKGVQGIHIVIVRAVGTYVRTFALAHPTPYTPRDISCCGGTFLAFFTSLREKPAKVASLLAIAVPTVSMVMERETSAKGELQPSVDEESRKI